MEKAGTLIRTKLRPPFIRTGLVPRPLLQTRISEGLCGPLTLITAPAGFGKTTLLASCISGLGMPIAWLSLDKDDNQVWRFLSYLIAALQRVDNTVGNEATQLLATVHHAPPETVLTSLINDLDTGGEIILVLDDYQFINNQAVHDAVVLLLEYCPNTLHVVIATRSDPPLPLARFRARSQTIEIRTSDLRFTLFEAAEFLNDIMGLRLDKEAVAVLEERTEGWIAGLQMAALSIRDREDVLEFLESFSGTHRYIMDYLLEEVLASQPPKIQCFLLCTSILERLSAPLCEAVLEADNLEDWIVDKSPGTFQPSNFLKCQPILEYLERANLFLMPLDDKRQWYRYHHLFADLLRNQLRESFGIQGVAQLHLRASDWYEQYGSILEAIHHASLASDFERIEHLIEQNYIEMMNRGEMSWIRYWMGTLSKEQVTRRPWLCLYEAMNHSWFGRLEEANQLLEEAEKQIRSSDAAGDIQAMLGYHEYVQSRVIAMQGDTRRAIELCHTARETIPKENLGLQIDVNITLGYEYFLYGDFDNANKILQEMIRLGDNARAVNNPVAGYAILARMLTYQGQLQEAYDLFQKAMGWIKEANGEYLGVKGLIEIGLGTLLCEWNEIEPALVHLKKGIDLLPSWGKADDFCLAYNTLWRIQIAQGNWTDASDTIEKATQLIHTCGVFSEARNAVEAIQVQSWLAHGDWSSVNRWVATLQKRFDSSDRFRFEDELTHITQARVLIAQDKPDEAIRLLFCLEESARSGGRQGRLIEIMMLKAIVCQKMGESQEAESSLTESLTLAESSGYVRIFLDEGRPLHTLIAQWLSQANPGPLRDYAVHLLSQFDVDLHRITISQEKVSPVGDLVEPLSPREIEVLHLMALGRTNREIARELFVSVGTIKAHTSNIYRKLDVANRTEAIARARQLGILP